MFNRTQSRLHCLLSGLSIAAKHVAWEDEARAAGLVGFTISGAGRVGPSPSEHFAQGC